MPVLIGAQVAQWAIWLYLIQEFFEEKAWLAFLVFAATLAAQYALFVWSGNKTARSESAEENIHAQRLYERFHEMMCSLTNSQNREQLLERILEYLKNKIPDSACAVYLASDDEKGILKLNCLNRYESEKLPLPDRIPVMDAVNRRVPMTICRENAMQTRAISTLSCRSRSVGAVDLYKPGGLSFQESALYQLSIDYASSLWSLYDFLTLLEEEAFIDPLTGVWNRRYMTRRLEEENERIRRYGGNACLVMGDMGNFKHVNDRYGHTKGDEALTQAAAAIKKNLRISDIVGRYGGDEFILLLPNITKPDADIVITRISTALKNLRIRSDDSDPESPPIKIVMDFGIAIFPGDAPTLMEIINQADGAMYANKAARKTKEEKDRQFAERE
jgi:diguanylate cyclase (GGDEF)-like protein